MKMTADLVHRHFESGKRKVIKQTTLMPYVIAAPPVAFACACARSRVPAK